MRNRRALLPLAFLATFALAARATAQRPSLADLRPGQTLERVASATDTAQKYAIYLPAGYTPDRDWPVLFAMDPRGRAMVPMRLFRTQAERLGWIVLSSYNTASDVAVDPNPAAVEAMLADVQRAFRVDGRRLYLAGFSGTARAGWSIAMRLPDNVAGLMGFGAGIPGEAPFVLMRAGSRFSFAFFTGAGNEDFNYDEVRTLNGRLDATNIPHRFAAYPGPHSWPPEPVCAEAMQWMELQAVKRGLARHPQGWMDSAYDAEAARAQAGEAAGDRVGALARWRQVVEDFGGRRDVGAAQVKITELAAARDVRDALERSARTARRDSTLRSAHIAVFRQADLGDRLPSAERLARDVGIAALKREAARTDDTLAANSARRLLQNVLSFVAYYGPTGYMESGKPERALTLLDVAVLIEGEGPQVCFDRAKALARLGRTAQALDALDCVAKAPVDPAVLEREADFASLRTDARYTAILERLRAARASTPRPPPGG